MSTWVLTSSSVRDLLNSWVLACEIYSTQLILFMNFSHFIVEPSKFLLGYFWGLFLVLIRFVPGGVHWVIGPMTPPWYKMNTQQNLPIWFLKTPGTNEPGYRAKFARLDDEILRRIHTKHVDWQPRITCLNSRNACPRKTTWHRRTLKSTLHPTIFWEMVKFVDLGVLNFSLVLPV